MQFRDIEEDELYEIVHIAYHNDFFRFLSVNKGIYLFQAANWVSLEYLNKMEYVGTNYEMPQRGWKVKIDDKDRCKYPYYGYKKEGPKPIKNILNGNLITIDGFEVLIPETGPKKEIEVDGHTYVLKGGGVSGEKA